MQLRGWKGRQQCQRELLGCMHLGGQGRVVRFKIFKKGGFDALGRHMGSRNTPRISKEFQNEAVRGHVTGGTPALLSFSWLILTGPLAPTHTGCVHAHTHFIWVPKCLSIAHKLIGRIKMTWNCQLWLFSNMALLGKKKMKNRKCNGHRTVLCLDDWQLKDIHKQKVLSDSLLTQWSHTWLGTAPRDKHTVHCT